MLYIWRLPHAAYARHTLAASLFHTATQMRFFDPLLAPFERLRIVLLTLSLFAATGSARAQSDVSAAAPIAGEWILTVRPSNGRELGLRMTLRALDRDRWEAFGRRNAVQNVLGWRKTMAARLLGKLPPHGAVSYVDAGRAVRIGDTVRVRGRFVSQMAGGTWYLTGSVVDGRLNAELRRTDSLGPVVGVVNGERAISNAPLRDYRALATEVRTAFETYFYDPVQLKEPRWRAFFDDIDRRFARARDDADVMLSFYAVRSRLPVSHIELVRNPTLARTPLDSVLASGGNSASLVRLTFPAPGVALLRVQAWNAVGRAVDRAFERIDSARVRTLVIDIRGNPGGDVSSIVTATHLLRDTTPVGVFLGPKWYAKHRAPPPRSMYATLPVQSDESAHTVVYGVREHGVILGVAPPRAPYFGGEVYLLQDGRSGSASEPLAHLLRSTGRATLIGERTAGGMLSAPPHTLRDGWVLVLPEADYFAADGTRLEGRGVPPHVEIPSTNALVATANRLRITAPYAGALLLGAAYQELANWVDAERAFADARAVAPDSIAPLFGLGFARQGRKAWDAAFATFDSVLALNAQHPGAFFQVGRTAALSGRELSRGEAALRTYLQRPVLPEQPSHAAAYWRLGMILQARGAHADARRAYQSALALEPAHAEARAALAALPALPSDRTP